MDKTTLSHEELLSIIQSVSGLQMYRFLQKL